MDCYGMDCYDCYGIVMISGTHFDSSHPRLTLWAPRATATLPGGGVPRASGLRAPKGGDQLLRRLPVAARRGDGVSSCVCVCVFLFFLRGGGGQTLFGLGKGQHHVGGTGICSSDDVGWRREPTKTLSV